MEDYIILKCPHCNDPLQIFKQEINCGIFRHGIYKNGTQLDPHASKEICDKFINEKQGFGCGKPFRISINEKNFHIESCDYI
jgi:hypothetical protein